MNYAGRSCEDHIANLYKARHGEKAAYPKPIYAPSDARNAKGKEGFYAAGLWTLSTELVANDFCIEACIAR
jgi:hypothetical protein